MTPLLTALAPGVTLDPATRLAHLRRLLQIIQTPTSTAHVVGAGLAAVMDVVLLALRDPQVPIRDIASLLISAIVQQYAPHVHALTGHVLAKLLEVLHVNVREIRDVAQDALLLVLPVLHAPACYDMVLPLLTQPDAAVIQTALRVLTRYPRRRWVGGDGRTHGTHHHRRPGHV